jgi:hypothetical protein
MRRISVMLLNMGFIPGRWKKFIMGKEYIRLSPSKTKRTEDELLNIDIGCGVLMHLALSLRLLLHLIPSMGYGDV